jgi:hypothetical protein
MYGLLLLVEAVRQIRKECGDRQLANANVALAHGTEMFFQPGHRHPGLGGRALARHTT